ncbi:MAG: 1-(5-phosphoribosyl)-5-[(5-phosphoribosylamino)methylideneamino] imidazole-4-carboxamide isomerase [Thermovirgaceae bacterium]|nr:1-(5-phosphoribosyl)-5-[(5-phosphoribosylamino)methylideneamino] imidazole-4-carboxamide isomerase [Thermovirgaceae bacterium]
MDLFPAIDLQENKVSRLRKGDFQDCVKYPVDPFETALSFAKTGFKHLHVVDLDGARYGTPAHTHLIRDLASTGLSLQFGGGLRKIEDIEHVLTLGAARAMVGSLLFSSNGTARKLFRLFGDRILPAVDIKEGHAAVRGWSSLSDLPTLKALEVLLDAGFTEALVTSTERDGTLSGPDIELYGSILEKFPGFFVIAAGGISSCSDIEQLQTLGCTGTVLGKSIYEGRIDPRAALKLMRLC